MDHIVPTSEASSPSSLLSSTSNYVSTDTLSLSSLSIDSSSVYHEHDSLWNLEHELVRNENEGRVESNEHVLPHRTHADGIDNEDKYLDLNLEIDEHDEIDLLVHDALLDMTTDQPFYEL